MACYSFFPKLSLLRHCFIHLPDNIFQNSKFSNIALIEWEGGSVFMWVTPMALPDYVCIIDKNYSSCIGLKKDHRLLVSFPHFHIPECINLVIIPNSIEDWNTLQPEAQRLSLKLLEQQRIAWKGLIIPFWVHANVCVFLRIINIDPKSDIVVLRTNTKVCFYQDIKHYSLNISKCFQFYNYEYDVDIIRLLISFEDDDFVPSLLMWQIIESFEKNLKHFSTNDRNCYKLLDNHNLIEESQVFYETLVKSTMLKFVTLNLNQFKTDCIDVFLKSSQFIFPNATLFSKIFHSNQSEVILFVSLISISNDMPLVYLCIDSFPIRIYRNTDSYSKSNINILYPKYSFSKCAKIILRPVNSYFVINKIILQTSQLHLKQYGESYFQSALRSFLMNRSKDSPFPIKNGQNMILQADFDFFPVQFKLEFLNNILNTDESISLIYANFLDNITLTVSSLPDLDSKIEHPLDDSSGLSFPNEDLFYGNNSLKFKAKRIIASYFSQLNNRNNILTLLITSDIAVPRMGRKSFLNYIIYLTRQYDTHLSVNFIDGVLLRGKKLEIIKKSLENLFVVDGIAIIYNIEYLLPESKEEQSFRDYNTYFLCYYILSLISRHQQKSNKILFISTSRASELVHSLLIGKSGRHFFQYLFVIPPATSQDKFSVIHGINRSYGIDLDDEILCDKMICKYPNVTPSEFDIVIRRSIQNRILHNTNISTYPHRQELLKQAFDYFYPFDINKNSGNCSEFDFLSNKKAQIQIIENIKFQSFFPKIIESLPLAIKIGILVYGMPGTGKTFLVEQIAKMNKVKLFKIRGPELLNKFVGTSEENIRNIFSSARGSAPSIIFFDEFDSFARYRGFESTGVLDRIVNQLLTEIDGVIEMKGVTLIAATCHPELIDPALLRIGRLGNHVKCSLPDLNDRIIRLGAIISETGIRVNNLDLIRIAELTKGFSCADLKALISNCVHERLYNRQTCFTLYEAQLNNSQFYFSLPDLMRNLEITHPSISEQEKTRYDIAYNFFSKTGSGRLTGIKSTMF